MKFSKYIQLNQGFTLVEMLVAVLIFSTSLIVLISVSSSAISSISDTRQKVTAQYLAEEGLEYVRHVRDSFAIQYLPDSELFYKNFQDFLNNCSSGCDFNVLENGVVVSNPSEPMSYNAESGYIGRNPSAINQSKYTRTITFSELGFNNINAFEVVSTVSWPNIGGQVQTISFSTVLFFNRP